MNKRIFLAAVAVLALAACGGRDEAGDDAMLADNSANATADEAANGGESASSLATADFAASVAASDMYEIESGKLASEKATSAEIRAFGQMLVTDHQKSSADLKTAASEARPAVAVMPALKPEQQQMLDALRSASAADFDRTFVDQQKQAHQMALDLLQRYSREGDVDSLKAFAAKTAPVVQKHLDQVNAMKPAQ